MLKCVKCGAEHDRQADKSRMCLPCKREYGRQWRLARKAAGNPVKTAQMPPEYNRDYQRKYFSNPENIARRNANMRAYAKTDKASLRNKARRKVRTAIDSGRMTRLPCEVCGAEKTHAHHDDYSKPLEVRWLCLSHHREHHAKAKVEKS